MLEGFLQLAGAFLLHGWFLVQSSINLCTNSKTEYRKKKHVTCCTCEASEHTPEKEKKKNGRSLQNVPVLVCEHLERGWRASRGHLSPNLTVATQYRVERTGGAVHLRILIQLGIFLSRLLSCIVLRCLAQLGGGKVVFIGKPLQRMTCRIPE